MFRRKRKSISFRMTEELESLIDILSDKLMISKTDVITMSIIKFAINEGFINNEAVFDTEDLAVEVGKQFQSDLAPIADAITAMSRDFEEMRNRLDELEKIKRIKGRTEIPHFAFNPQRESGTGKIIVTDDDKR